MIKTRFLCILVLLNIGCNRMSGNSKKNNDLVLNVPIHSPVNLKKIDSKKIVSTIQYQLLINLNLTLLEYDKNANLVTLLAEDFDIDDREIIFKIKKGVKTISGHEIKAKDAEVSLIRLIMSNDGSHSKLSDLLCPGDGKDVSSKCPGISSHDYELKITARKKTYIPFILSLLTNADNVILPLTALDSPLASSSILNLKETSGPYYIDNESLKDEPMEKIKLTLNKSHFLNDGNLSSEVNYSTVDEKKLLDGEYNYFHNVSGLKLETIKKIESKSDLYSVYPTVLIKNTILLPTDKGRKLFSNVELIYFGLKIRDFLLSSKEYYPNIIQPQVSYFPSESEGNLNDDQFSKVLKNYEIIKSSKIKKSQKVRVGIFKLLYEKYKDAFKDMPDVELVKLTTSPHDKNVNNVDLFLETIDSSFTESLDLLQYNKTFGIFDITDQDMKNYIDAESKEVRVKLVQDIHYKSLMEGRFINIGAAPYYTILSKDWVAEPPKFFVGFPVWKIKRKN